MKKVLVLLIAGVMIDLIGCAAIPPSEKAAAAEQAAEAATAAAVTWEYPIAPGVWYPGDGPLPEHPRNYYRIRCWPGCHDPNSQPRPKN